MRNNFLFNFGTFADFFSTGYYLRITIKRLRCSDQTNTKSSSTLLQSNSCNKETQHFSHVSNMMSAMVPSISITMPVTQRFPNGVPFTKLRVPRVNILFNKSSKYIFKMSSNLTAKYHGSPLGVANYPSLFSSALSLERLGITALKLLSSMNRSRVKKWHAHCLKQLCQSAAQ